MCPPPVQTVMAKEAESGGSKMAPGAHASDVTYDCASQRKGDA